MIATPYDLFIQSTAGRYTLIGGSVIVWCASPTLCGMLAWGDPTEDDARAVLHAFDQYPTQMADRFDIVLDTRGVVRIPPPSMALLFSWMLARHADLARHLRMQANVIREGPVAFLVTGVLSVAQWSIPYRIDRDPLEAFRAVAGAEGVAVCEELEAFVESVRGVPRELRVTRAMLEARLDASVDDVARSLGTSARSLQRVLRRHGTSFHGELVVARLKQAQALLVANDYKVAAIASRVGISERGLTLLFRSKTGMGPAEWRKHHTKTSTD